MKTVTPRQLREAYETLFPAEKAPPNAAVPDLPYSNWLHNYEINPEFAIATCNWFGKVTQALFLALKIKKPRAKKDMLAALS